MSGPLQKVGGRLGYGTGQSARLAWYIGHYLALQRMRGPLNRPGEAPYKPKGRVPGIGDLLKGIVELFEQDWAHIEDGDYLAPRDGLADPGALIARSRAFFKDAPRVDQRRMSHSHSEVLTPEIADRYPRYYLQNFHYQSDGWLSEESAKLYDTQVEVLFAGTADAMRRQALKPIGEFLRGHDQRKVQMADIACGTGRFLSQVKDNFPGLRVTGVDLSSAYLKEARNRLRNRPHVAVAHANAEALPFATESLDIVTCVYLFHELPPKIRTIVAGEIARVLKPGGLFVLVDALQTGDRPDYDGLLELFPVGFHEPYFNSYLAEDFEALFSGQGLNKTGTIPAFLSTVTCFRKAA